MHEASFNFCSQNVDFDVGAIFRLTADPKRSFLEHCKSTFKFKTLIRKKHHVYSVRWLHLPIGIILQLCIIFCDRVLGASL